MNGEYLQRLFGLEGQTAVVVGGTGVLGGELATGLASAGAYVVVAGRSVERGEARAAAIKAAGGEAEFAEADVTSRESIEALCAGVVARRGGVDALINGAGVNSASGYLDVKDDDWDRVLRSNLSTPCIGAAKSSGGR